MNLTGKINVFVEHKPYKKNGEEKIFYKLTTSIASKKEDGSYIRKQVNVFLNDKKYPEALLAKLNPMFMYVGEIAKGWIIVDDYVNADGKTVKNLAIYVDEIKWTGRTAIDQDKRNKALASANGGASREDSDLPW